MWVVTAGQRQDADLVVTGVLVALDSCVNDCVDFTHSQWSLDDGALAKTTQVRTATHDLYCNSVMNTSQINESYYIKL